jgi:putative aldouronate transport system permease protein
MKSDKDAKKSIATKVKQTPWQWADFELTVLALPTTIWYILFSYLPMFGVIIAFKDFRISSGSFLNSLLKSAWVGFDNFKVFFANKDIALLVRNTIGYNLVFIFLGAALAVGCSVAVNELRSKKLAKIYQTAMFLPHFLSWVVVSAVILGFLSFRNGLVNQALSAAGFSPHNWYNEPDMWPIFLVVVGLWKSLGYSMVIYLASIAGIDATLFEAAVIDGASKWQQVCYITIPSLKRVIVMMFILNVGHIFSTDFGLFYQVTLGANALYKASSTVDVFIYNNLSNTTLSASASLLQSVLACITILLANQLVKKIDDEMAII